MNNSTRRIISIAIGIAFILGGFLIARYFVKNKPEAKRRRPMSSMVPVVETAKYQSSSQTLKIECLGTVTADRMVEIQPEVKGRIVAVNPALIEGERISKGKVLIEIESADYELALAKAETALLTAQSKLRIEQGQQDVVRKELELMGDDESDAYRDLTLREPQLKSAEAEVKSAQLAVESAKLDLDRTKIRAPFDAVVISRTADVGDYAQNNKLAELAAIDRYFIYASVPLSALEPLPEIGTKPYPAKVILSDGSTCKAQVGKLLPGLTEKGRMARILLPVENPYEGNSRPLLLNEVVRVHIAGEIVEKAALLPRKYLRDGNVVWTIDKENKLSILPVEVLQGYADEALVRVNGLSRFEVVTTDLPAAVDGMQLRRVGEPAPQMKPGMGGGKGQGKPGAGKPGMKNPDGQTPAKKEA